MAKVELKKPVVAEISENIKDAQAVVLVRLLRSYCGGRIPHFVRSCVKLVLPTRYTRTQ